MNEYTREAQIYMNKCLDGLYDTLEDSGIFCIEGRNRLVFSEYAYRMYLYQIDCIKEIDDMEVEQKQEWLRVFRCGLKSCVRIIRETQ